ncbi:molybdopterin converting factor subunit 1 [Niallia nealsonii]|uniref:Molybdopterin synthase sulfur carrier subunit n=1 Tax=Niallia nealsonii TaxID=115979 RepID=A0A2N0YZ82_9BACI|nr:molybdopterin converting factor subunit 1 [Niallia nealsonii]PKG22562.1 molybdopterin converting factor subunit 1 [Niallia nealsonii]
MNKVLFFAALKEVIGEDSLQMDLNGKTVGEAKSILQDKFPALPLEVAMTAINEEFAFDEDIIKKEDSIAFIPPVSGG